MGEDIAAWFNKQPAWMREAVETYVKKGEIEEGKIVKLADICVSEAKGEDCSKYRVSDTNLLSMDTGSSFAIKKISGIEGVNAIDTDKSMDFSKKGINVIYGVNGSGKSGYIRIFKMISGATYREEIKANIYKSKSITPKCVVTVEENGKPLQDFHCNLQTPGEHDILKKIDIFDTKIAQGYVNKEKEAAFEPWIFGLFSALGEAASKVKVEITDRKDKIQMNSYAIPQLLADVDAVKALEKLTFKSKLENFIKDFSQKDEELLKELKSKSQIEKNKLAIKLKNGEISNLTEILDYFKLFESFYTEVNFNNITALAEDWKSKSEAYKLSQELLNNNIDNIDKKSQAIDAWRELWKHARNLFDAVKIDTDHDFTAEDGVCPLCHHKITTEESIRMKSIDEYVNGVASTLEQQAKTKYKQILIHSQTKKTEELVSKTGEFRDEFEKLIKTVNSILIENKTAIDKFADSPISLTFANIEKVTKPVSEKITELKNNVQVLRKLNEVDDQKKILEEIVSLEARKAIKENEYKIRDNVQRLKDRHLYDTAIKKTATNKLTSKSKDLAKELITDAYIGRFNEELKKLSASGLTARIVPGGSRVGKNPGELSS